MSDEEPAQTEHVAVTTAVRTCPSCGELNTYRGIEGHPSPLSVCGQCGHEWAHVLTGTPSRPDVEGLRKGTADGMRIYPETAVRLCDWALHLERRAASDPGETAEQARERRDIRVMAALRSGAFTEGARICFGRADAGWAVWGDGDEMLDPDRAPFFDDPADAIEWAASLCGAPALTEGRPKAAPTPGSGPTEGRDAAAIEAWGEDCKTPDEHEDTWQRAFNEGWRRASMRSPEPPPELPEGWQRAHPDSPGREGNLAAVYDGCREVVVTEDGRMVFAMSPGLLDAPVPVVIVALSDAGLLPGARSPDEGAVWKLRRMEGREPYQNHVVIDGERHQVYVCYNCNIETTSNPCDCGAFVRPLYADEDPRE